MPLILPGNVASATAGAFSVANSCRFNDGDSPHMEKDQGTPTSQNKYTYSGWIKKCTNTAGDEQHIFSLGDGGDSVYNGFRFKTNDTLELKMDSTDTGSGIITTNRVFRDPAAWYHIVVGVDTTQGTAANRVKLYVNGVQETSFSTATYPTEDRDYAFLASGQEVHIGNQASSGNTEYFDGYMAEVVFIDGLQLAATSFGEFNSDSPTIWQPIDVSGLTFGTNGFYLDFEASDNLGNDANGGTDLTETNLAATDQATDTPTNNFATLNPVCIVVTGPGTFAEGACKITGTGNDACYVSTLGVKTGKWYFEVVPTAGCRVGAMSDGSFSARTVSDGGLEDLMGAGTQYRGVAYASNGKGYPGNGGSTNTSYGATYTDGDIIGVLLNLDDGEITFEKNDADQGTLVTDLNDYQQGEHWCFAVQPPAADDVCLCNFGGCPAFTVSSGNADANGYGNFEYAVPSGYYALCTKNLAEYG